MNFSFGSSEEVLVIGGDVSTPKRDALLLWYYGSCILLLLMLLFSFYFTSDLLTERQMSFKMLSGTKAKRELEEKNLVALKNLSSSVDTLSGDRALVEAAVPEVPRPEQVVSLIEQMFLGLQRTHRVILPEVISWAEVPETDIKAEEYADLGVTEFRFSYFGDYEGFLELLKWLRTSRRILDIRSVRSLEWLPKESSVKADLSLWAYHLTL